jgi:hypothetical protein
MATCNVIVQTGYPAVTLNIRGGSRRAVRWADSGPDVGAASRTTGSWRLVFGICFYPVACSVAVRAGREPFYAAA